MSSTVSLSFEVRNETKEDQFLIFELWGNHIILQPKMRVKVEVPKITPDIEGNGMYIELAENNNILFYLVSDSYSVFDEQGNLIQTSSSA